MQRLRSRCKLCVWCMEAGGYVRVPRTCAWHLSSSKPLCKQQTHYTRPAASHITCRPVACAGRAWWGASSARPTARWTTRRTSSAAPPSSPCPASCMCVAGGRCMAQGAWKHARACLRACACALVHPRTSVREGETKGVRTTDQARPAAHSPVRTRRHRCCCRRASTTRARSPMCTPLAPRSAPRCPTPAGTWPSSG